MCELQTRGVQSLSFERVERRDQFDARATRHASSAAIHRIAHDRIADMREMHADLMGAACLQLNIHQRVRPEAARHAIVSDRIAPVATHRHPGSNAAMSSNRTVDRATARHHSVGEGEIFALDFASRQRGDQALVHLRSSRYDQQSAGIFVETMHDPRAGYMRELWVEREQRILQSVLRISRARMHHQARGLVDDEERCDPRT